MTQTRPAAVIVLAAGSGTRMKSKLMKVLHPVCGRSMIGHVVTAALAVEPQHLVAVVGNGRDQVGPHVLELAPDALLAVQETQDGTGHAVRVGLDALRESAGTTVGHGRRHGRRHPVDAGRDDRRAWCPTTRRPGARSRS